MKTLLRTLVTGALAGCTMLYSQNFNGSDDFSSVTANWSLDVTSTGGLYTVSGGVLNFTDGGITSPQISSAARNWTLNAGSYTADWQVQVDLNLGVVGQTAGQVTTWSVSLASSLDSTDFAQFTVQQNYMMSTIRNLNGEFFSNNSVYGQASTIASSNLVTVRASFLAASHELTWSYSTGSGFSPLVSAVVDGTGLNWGMGSGDTFNFNLRAYNITSAGPTSPLMSGVYADNFIASPTAVPEPSAYAALVGLVALSLALWRRS